jgi:hypothetical protein
MNYENIPASFVPLESTKVKAIDYSILEDKYSNDFNLHKKYRTGQQYKLTSDKGIEIVSLVIESVFDEIKANATTPEKKILIENHRRIILDLLKNTHDSEITVDSKSLITIIDGVIHTNAKQLYKKDSR